MLEAELTRVRAEAEEHLADELQRVQAEAELARATELADAEVRAEQQREDALRQAREVAQVESERALEIELKKVREEQDRRLQDELERARNEAEQARRTLLAESEEKAEQVRDHVWIESADAADDLTENTLVEELERIQTESDDRLADELTRIQTDADQALAGQQTDAHREADRLKETAAQEAREVAEAAAERTLQSEVERVRAEAERTLAEELARFRRDTDDQRSKEVAEITSQVAKLRDVAVKQMRKAAAEALVTELGRVRSNSPAIVRETVVPLAAGTVTRPPESIEPTLTDREPPQTTDTDAEAADASVSEAPSSYYSLWRTEHPDTEPETVASEPHAPRLRQIGFALGAAACVLVAVTAATWATSDDSAASVDGLAAGTESAEESLTALPEPVEEVVPPGWVAISSSIEMDVWTGGERLGSTADERLALAAGSHQIEVVNEQLGFRTTISMEVAPGEVADHTLELPDGHLRIDGPTGADVWVGGRLIGQTPLSDTPIVMGLHDVVVRHPALGEWREEVVVGADAPTVLTVGDTDPIEQ